MLLKPAMAAAAAARAGLSSGRPRAWLPVLLICGAAIGALWYVLPRAPRNPLDETTVWSLLIVLAFAGWGSLVRLAVARSERVDLGLRVVWGAAALCTVGGLLAAFSIMNRGAVFVLVESGIALALGSAVLERIGVTVRLRALGRSLRRDPGLALIGAAVVGVLALTYLAGISETHTNPYDDDIAYLAFVRKMLDTGTVLEPFSLRRLSAFGGQTFFLELVAVRAAPSQGHTFDRSIALLMVVLLLVGHRTKTRRLPAVVTLVAVAFFLILPNVSINTASYYSGVAFFLGLFRTLMWLGRRERRPWESALPLGLVAAASCTLRQNYIAVPVVVIGVSYGFNLLAGTASLRERLLEPALVAGATALALAPWCVVAYQSNLTFLYPVMAGTANPALQFQSGSSTPLREVYLLMWTLLEGLPTKLIGFFLLAAALIREKDHRRPLWAFALGCTAGLVALVHGLTQGDAANLGRYAFGFLGALILAVVLVACMPPFDPGFRRRHAAAGVALFGVMAGLVEARTDLYKYFDRATRNIEELARNVPRSALTDPPEVALYQRLQGAVPVGARLAVMLDEPYNLDFARNPIWNLDMPGYSSLPPGMPYFKGSERVESYLRGRGVRYLAFVKIGYSRYHFRRDYWVQEVVDETEVWRAHAPYVIDFLDNLTAIEGRHRVAFAERGLVVVDLEAPR